MDLDGPQGMILSHIEENCINGTCMYLWASLVVQMVKNLLAMPETRVRFLGLEDPLEEKWQTTPVFLPGESPWTEEPGGLQFMGLQRVIHDLVTKNNSTNMNPQIIQILPTQR